MKTPFCRLFEFWEKPAAKIIGACRSPIEGSSGLPPLAQPFGRLQAGLLWKAVADSAAFHSLNHIPPLPIPHGLEYPLGSRMHFGVAYPRLEARGRPFPRFPRVPLTREPTRTQAIDPGTSGSALTLRTPQGRPGVQGIFPTSRGQAPDGWRMVHHSMATGFPIPRGCCSAFYPSCCPLVRNPATSLSPVPLPVTHLGPFPASRAFPFSSGCCVALAPRPSLSCLLLPSSRVYTPPGRQQPCGAGPLDPHRSGDRFVRLARVAPFPPPSQSPVPRSVTYLGLFPASGAFPFSWRCCAALATRPSLSRPLFPSSCVYTPLDRQQPFGAAPLDPHPSGDRFGCLVLVAPSPPPFVWMVCFFLDLLGALLPGPAPASPGTRAYSPPGHLRFFFSHATRGPSSAPFASSRSPAACSLCAFPPSGGALWC